MYDRVAVSNVATQIEQLFWYASEPEDLLDVDGKGGDGVLRIGDDLTESENIHKLSSFVDEDEADEDLLSAVQRLQDLDAKRIALERKLEQYRRLQELLKPLRDPQENVQKDLVTRDGALAEELARTKALGMRVAGGIAKRNERGDGGGGGGEEDDVVTVDEGAKVAAVLGRR